ncbi:unnamed protein product [Merluccius merluccius]
MKRLEMDNVVEDKEVPSSSTAEASATASPGTDDLDPVHLEAQGPGSLERERARQQEGGVWVIHPLSPFRRYYTLFMMVITLENLVSLPVEMMMPSHDGNSIHMGFSLFCDTMFLVDVALNFRMGIMSKDREVVILDLHTIKKTYLKTWFIPDLLSAFPIDMILMIAEILAAVCRTLLKKVPMFKAQGANFINAVLPKLVFEVFQEGDIIFREKAPGDRMFFISEGNVGIEMDGVQRELFDGDYFGEVGLLKHGMRAATARALTICRVFSLSADSLHQILHSFPHVKQQIQETAVRRGRNN